MSAEEKRLEDQILAAEQILQGLEQGSEALRAETLRAERAFLRLEGEQGVDHSGLISRFEAGLDKATSKVRRLEEEIYAFEEEHSQRKETFERLEELVAQRRAEHAAATKRLTRLTGELEVLRERRERAVGRLEEPDVSEEELGEMEEKLGWYAPEGLRTRCAAVLGQLEELRLLAAEKVAEANRRRGMLAAVIGRTEAEVQALRALGRNGVEGKRLYEIVRPRPGYEAAVEAALGDLAGGVLAETLGEGLKFLSGIHGERLVVRLDAERVPKNGAPPGKSLIDCVEILDTSYADALERLLDGIYVLEELDWAGPNNGHVAVTHEGLRFTRTSASLRTPDGDFARQARLAEEEERLDALRNRLEEEIHDLREAAFSGSRRLNEQVAEVEALGDVASRVARVARLLVSETGRRARKAQAARERRSADEAHLHGAEAEISVTEDELRGAREVEERTREELDGALSSSEAAYTAARESAGRLARARVDLQSVREHRARISRGLAGLKKDMTTGENACRTDLACRAARHARRLDAAVRKRLVRLRSSRSDAARLQVRATEKRLALAEEVGDVTGELARAQSEVAALQGELSQAEEDARTAEAEIFEEWGATLEAAREAAETVDSERERTRLARKLKNFGDVNLLAIGQEGQLRERCEFVAAQRSDAEAAATEIKRIIQDVDGEIEARFKATFREVRRAFAGMVPRMMEGAVGELELSDEGVEIGLKLKGRGWRSLRVLSGGERSLLALAFLFSIFLGRSSGGPGAFCMLDEAEAALDDINLARFLAVVDSYRADGQFLLVTHQKRTMAAADVLYGVAPDTSGATVVVSKRLTGE